VKTAAASRSAKTARSAASARTAAKTSAVKATGVKPGAKTTSKPTSKTVQKTTAKKTTAKTVSKTVPKASTKASAAKSPKTKRSEMPKTSPKTAVKPSAAKAPAKTAEKPVASKPAVSAAAPKPAASKPVVTAAKPVAAAAAPKVEEKKPLTQRQGFKTNEFVVYPAHGVGQILAIEEQEIAGAKLELFVINFIKDKMTLRVPTAKVTNVGMRKLSEPALVKRALETLKGRARVKRTMWSRRAQEYEAKINSGDIVAIAEVVRDLFRSESQPEQSYSERQLYEAALDRLSREIAVVQHVTETEAIKEVEGQLAKSPRRGAKTEEVDAEAEADADADDLAADEAA